MKEKLPSIYLQVLIAGMIVCSLLKSLTKELSFHERNHEKIQLLRSALNVFGGKKVFEITEVKSIPKIIENRGE
jgi:hypothetical protein